MEEGAIYGAITVKTLEDGKLYIDGKYIKDMSSGSKSTFKNIKAGKRTVELQYSDKTDKMIILVEENKTAEVSFTYSKPIAKETSNEIKNMQSEINNTKENIIEAENIFNEAKNWHVAVKEKFIDNKKNYWDTGKKEDGSDLQSIKIQNGVYHWEMKAKRPSYPWNNINYRTGDTIYLSSTVNKISGSGNYGLCFFKIVVF